MTDIKQLRRNVVEAKRRHAGALVLQRIGDFYEAIDEDATVLSVVTGRQTARNAEGVVFCGIPYHALNEA
ncbi:hypothetical protein LCGC14_2228420, partial [marine sediment metagenome]